MREHRCGDPCYKAACRSKIAMLANDRFAERQGNWLMASNQRPNRVSGMAASRGA